MHGVRLFVHIFLLALLIHLRIDAIVKVFHGTCECISSWEPAQSLTDLPWQIAYPTEPRRQLCWPPGPHVHLMMIVSSNVLLPFAAAVTEHWCVGVMAVQYETPGPNWHENDFTRHNLPLRQLSPWLTGT